MRGAWECLLGRSASCKLNIALAATCAGLATPDQKFRFLQKLTHSKIERDFADQIELSYLQPFAAQRGVQGEQDISDLRKQLIEKIKDLLKLPPIFSGENRRLTESELAAFISYEMLDFLSSVQPTCSVISCAFFVFFVFFV